MAETFDAHMPPTDPGLDILRQLVAASNAIFPIELRSRACEAMNGKLAWRPEDADEVIAFMQSSGAAIMAGESWADDGQGQGPRSTVSISGTDRSHMWHCRREAGEEWAAFVQRAAVAARDNMEQAAKVASEIGPNYAPLIRFSWVTEEQPSQYDLPAVVRRMSDEASTKGGAPWVYIGLAGNILGVDVRRAGPTAPWSFYSATSTGSLAPVPRHAAFLSLYGKVNDLERLTDFQSLETLRISGVGDRELALIGRLSSIRILSIAGIRATSLDALSQLSRLEHLECSDSGTLRSLDALAGLDRLCTLRLEHLRKLAYLEEAARLTQLRGLAVSGSMWSHARVPSLTPLAKLRNLRSLRLTGVRVEDGSLRTLTTLDNLRILELSNWFRAEEFAEIAAAFPDLADPGYRSMWWTHPRPADQEPYAACRGCKAYTRGMTIGKPMKQLCPFCDEAKIEKFAGRWKALVQAARDRRRPRERA